MSPASLDLEQFAQCIADFFFMLVPRPRPSRKALDECLIISHRGEHDNRQIKENTLEAFAVAVDAGVWGIEFDVRWTRDWQPVVIHDSDAKRVFGLDLDVATASLQELRLQLPEIPTLAEVVERFGGKYHLMIELKRDENGGERIKAERLRDTLNSLEAGVDYHILALDFELFELVEFTSPAALLPVATLNIGKFSRQTLAQNFAGLSGQYLLLNSKLIRRHQRQGQKIGTGFITSRFAFYRELNRGVDWIFTNHALRLCTLRRRLLDD